MVVRLLHTERVPGPNPGLATIQLYMVEKSEYNLIRLIDDFRWRHWCSGNMSACDAEVLGSTPR